ncbi:type II secretion system F family protein [Pseudosulfitobacter pseudonitzschiae]|uniref:type II secretion system F family protein n=1 Tax=Pseudosulfitobacter pseudonitzschiae TaxID=1402135 RepID=UPI001E4B2C62|nr:type II secretion system F family protein [Pseudosulfitobacter pseudonitzschiae]MCI2214067.1 type II secretion system F family protein [Pseudosulfitobacter pseudonitzschiae]UFE27051.1 type II secretion system F family protein [Pseudosulfitobacter pseudonitzschiae]UFE32418.1 type II secretion system F family protein [Pseudosulfitobacter pseudonitzschiae]UFE37993.1 type II secretion system F family protein [Pseudosulfitobacter pseudonitzschiae]UFE42514.1 type II secretion system F family prot
MPPLLLQIALAVPVLTALQLLVLNLIDRNARAARIGRTLGRLPVRSSAARQSLTERITREFRRIAQMTLERVSVMRGGEAEASAALLRAAGFRSRDAVLIHAFLKLVLPVAGLLLTILWFVIARDDATRLWVIMIWSCGVALGFSMAPDIILTHLRNRRFKQVRRSFPDMLELLVIASESGLSANPSLSRVATEIRAFCPPLASELQQLVIELSILPSRETAWRNFSERLPMSEITIFSNALMQAERYGTPFAGAMRTLMRDERAGRLLKIEEQAGRAPALMTVPLILFIMPPLFIVLVGPAVLSILDNIMDGGFG